jgi:hypothetical protein
MTLPVVVTPEIPGDPEMVAPIFGMDQAILVATAEQAQVIFSTPACPL